jgi:16S rRNA (adenine1518-N6/adenine1519-N6)-dimethyltransferase
MTAPRARKRFGQHFLAAPWAAKVVTAIAPEPGDVFLEIGPGTGALTLPLAASGLPVLAVELDRDLVQHLAPRVPRNVTLLSGDILTLEVMSYLRGLAPKPAVDAPLTADRSLRPRYRVVGNLPYNVASPIMIHLGELHRRHRFFTDATVMLQKEVADRLIAKPGTKAYGALFERLVKALFMYRRKTLTNALKRFAPSGVAVLERSGLDGRRRPETLTIGEIARLTGLFFHLAAPPRRA